MKRNWRHTDPPIYEPPDQIHLIWLLPIYVIIVITVVTIVFGGLYLLVWSVV